MTCTCVQAEPAVPERAGREGVAGNGGGVGGAGAGDGAAAAPGRYSCRTPQPRQHVLRQLIPSDLVPQFQIQTGANFCSSYTVYFKS